VKRSGFAGGSEDPRAIHTDECSGHVSAFVVKPGAIVAGFDDELVEGSVGTFGLVVRA
jgi:hypothetical protein